MSFSEDPDKPIYTRSSCLNLVKIIMWMGRWVAIRTPTAYAFAAYILVYKYGPLQLETDITTYTTALTWISLRIHPYISDYALVSNVMYGP